MKMIEEFTRKNVLEMELANEITKKIAEKQRTYFTDKEIYLSVLSAIDNIQEQQSIAILKVYDDVFLISHCADLIIIDITGNLYIGKKEVYYKGDFFGWNLFVNRERNFVETFDGTEHVANLKIELLKEKIKAIVNDMKAVSYYNLENFIYELDF